MRSTRCPIGWDAHGRRTAAQPMKLRTQLQRSLLLAACLGCSRQEPGPTAAFRDITGELGLFASATYPDGQYHLPEITAGGLALVDVEGDNDLEIYQIVHPPPARFASLAAGAPASNRLWRRDGRGRFEDVAGSAGADDPGHGQGVAVGDVNNDGFSDLYVTNFGPNRLLLNRGNGAFVDRTASAGLEDDAGARWSSSAAFADLDQDGHLDLFVVNYVQLDPELVCIAEGNRPDYCGPLRYNGTLSALYRNRGDGVFSNVTTAAGVGKVGRGLGIACADFTGDGRVDIYVANDREANCLWVNRGDGTFQDEALGRGVALSGAGDVESSMGVAVGDVDNNGHLDILVTNLSGETNTLYLAQGQGQFADRSASSGLSVSDILYTGWGCVFFDLESDGDLDLATVNGRVARGRTDAEGAPDPRLSPFWREYAERNLLFENDGSGHFSSLGIRGGDFTRDADNYRGLVAGDLDGDSDVDLVLTTTDNSLKVHRNESPRRHHWLRIRALVGRRDAIGALITLHIGGTPRTLPRQLVRAVHAAQSYASSSDLTVHFGLGEATQVEAIAVLWADGQKESFPGLGVAVDQTVTLRQGEGKAR